MGVNVSESKYFVWVNNFGKIYPQLWYNEYKRTDIVLFVKKLESPYDVLSFQELVKLFPYEPKEEIK